MTREAGERTIASAMDGPQVVDVPEAHVLDGEAGGRQAFRQQGLAARILGRH
jgi:hypothetical protein